MTALPLAHTGSYYAATANPVPDWPALAEDLMVDVAIIGGGFTGVAAAVELAERGLSVALVEANRIGWGASGRNGGQITGSLSGDTAMERQFARILGHDAQDFVWALRWRGHDIIRKRVAKYGIACDLKHGQVEAAWQESHVARLEATHARAVAHGMGDEVSLIRGAALRDYVGTDIYHAGLVNRRNMHVHSLNLCQGEAMAAESLGARIFTGTKVERITYGQRPVLHCAGGRITADKVLIAGNFWHGFGRARLAGRLFPASLGIVATEPLSEAVAQQILPRDYALYDTRFVLDYYRLTADRRLIFGSGTNYSGRDSHNLADKMRPAIERTFPQLSGVDIAYAWSGQDGISLNRIPQLGRLDSNVFYAQGYSGHGIATSHIMAEITAGAICGESPDFDAFSKIRHWRFPVGRTLGGLGISLGMALFKLRDSVLSLNRSGSAGGSKT